MFKKFEPFKPDKACLRLECENKNLKYSQFFCKYYLFLPDDLIQNCTFYEITLLIDGIASKNFMNIRFPDDDAFESFNNYLDWGWDVTYHGSSNSAISSILRHGEILIAGDVKLDGLYLENASNPDGAENPRNAFWTTHSPSFAFKYTNNNPKAILELLQKPFSYKSSKCCRANINDEMNGLYSLENIGNYSKSRGTIYIKGLILHLDENEIKKTIFPLNFQGLYSGKNFNFKPMGTRFGCDFASKCFKFLEAQQWPIEYFDPDGYRCYCPICFPKKWIDYLEQAGERYIIPRNWCRFGLKVSKIFVLINDIWDSWCNVFHGTTSSNAKAIVEHQRILINFDFSKKSIQIKTRGSASAKQSNYFLSPSIDYASHPWYSEMTKFGSMYAQIVLAIKIRPGTYDKQRETEGGAKKLFDDYRYIKEDEIEWFSKRRGCVVPYGVLVRVFNEEKKIELEKTSFK